MSSLIILRHLRVENANAISGITYGFPAITHFLGYTHALSRKLQASHGLTLEGCAVICHQQQIHSHANGRDRIFALTRNPLTKEAKTAPFNEEGRMHMTVSLLIECHGSIANGDQGAQTVAAEIQRLAVMQPLAGGTITTMGRVNVQAIPSDEQESRKVLRRLLPGFVLVDRSPLLAEHFAQLLQQQPQTEMLDAWLDFASLKVQAQVLDNEKEPVEGDAAEWRYLSKPAAGYLVPLMIGYQAISPLYPAGTVAKARDMEVPFRFSESVYGIGEWRGLHRIEQFDSLFWRYHYQHDSYLCRSQPAKSFSYDDINFDD